MDIDILPARFRTHAGRKAVDLHNPWRASRRAAQPANQGLRPKSKGFGPASGQPHDFAASRVRRQPGGLLGNFVAGVPR